MSASPGVARRFILAGAAIVALSLIGYFRFPGHTFLQSDTQIYIPILERFWDPSAFGREFVAQEPHVSFTVYDEAAIALRRLTGLEFRDVLAMEQFAARALGILGVFLLATALGLRMWPALFVAAVYSLGTTIIGPTVLTVEYEPVPRGFAVPLLLLALGLAAHGRDISAGIAAAVAFLYHAPTVLPFWAVYFTLTLWPSKPAVMRRRILGLLPVLAGVLALFVLSRMQTGVREAQDFFGRIGPELERLQRLRAPYNWISIWRAEWIVHYVFLWLVSLAAFLRIRKAASQDVRFFLLGLPLVGLLTMPLSYLLLDRMKWVVAPQAQPARALLFVAVLAVILAAIAAVKAQRWWESLLWLLPVFAAPLHTLVLELLVPDLTNPLIRRRVLVMLGLAALGALAIRLQSRRPNWVAPVWAAALFLPFLAIPELGQVRNYPALETPEVRELAVWARAHTPTGAMFLFPDAGRGLDPGIFRAEAFRAVYVDWKSGGQVNFLKKFAYDWWSRWQKTGAGKFRRGDVAAYPALGVDYFVLMPQNRLPDRVPVFENSRYLAYSVR